MKEQGWMHGCGPSLFRALKLAQSLTSLNVSPSLKVDFRWKEEGNEERCARDLPLASFGANGDDDEDSGDCVGAGAGAGTLVE